MCCKAFGYTSSILLGSSLPPELLAPNLPAEMLVAKTNALELTYIKMRAALEANTISFQRAMLLTNPAAIGAPYTTGPATSHSSVPHLAPRAMVSTPMAAHQPTSLPSASVMPSASMPSASMPSAYSCSPFPALPSSALPPEPSPAMPSFSRSFAAPVQSIPTHPRYDPGHKAPTAPARVVPSIIAQPPRLAYPSAAYSSTAPPPTGPDSEGVFHIAQPWPCAHSHPPPSSLPPSPPEPTAVGATSLVTLAFQDPGLEQAYRSRVVREHGGNEGVMFNGAVVIIFIAIIASEVVKVHLYSRIPSPSPTSSYLLLPLLPPPTPSHPSRPLPPRLVLSSPHLTPPIGG